MPTDGHITAADVTRETPEHRRKCQTNKKKYRYDKQLV